MRKKIFFNLKIDIGPKTRIKNLAELHSRNLCGREKLRFAVRTAVFIWKSCREKRFWNKKKFWTNCLWRKTTRERRWQKCFTVQRPWPSPVHWQRTIEDLNGDIVGRRSIRGPGDVVPLPRGRRWPLPTAAPWRHGDRARNASACEPHSGLPLRSHVPRGYRSSFSSASHRRRAPRNRTPTVHGSETFLRKMFKISFYFSQILFNGRPDPKVDSITLRSRRSVLRLADVLREILHKFQNQSNRFMLFRSTFQIVNDS